MPAKRNEKACVLGYGKDCGMKIYTSIVADRYEWEEMKGQDEARGRSLCNVSSTSSKQRSWGRHKNQSSGRIKDDTKSRSETYKEFPASRLSLSPVSGKKYLSDRGKGTAAVQLASSAFLDTQT